MPDRAPLPRVLILTEGRASALAGLLVWLATVAVFCHVSLAGPGAAAPFAAPGGAPWTAAAAGTGLVALVPLILLPYLYDCLRRLVAARRFSFDASARAVRCNGRRLAGFEQIAGLRLSARNLTCEELVLSLRLTDGRALELPGGGTRAATAALAEDIARLLGTTVERA